MTSMNPRLLLLGFMLFINISLAQAAALPAAAPGPLKIVKITDHEGRLSFEVLDDEIILLMKKDLDQRYKEAKRQWETERDAWKEKNPTIPFAMPKPLAPKVTVVAKGFESRSQAESEMAGVQCEGPYCIYQVVNGKKKSVDIASCDELDAVKYNLEKEYHAALAAWVEAKAAFEKDNPDRAFEDPMPCATKVRVLKNKIKSMELASSQMSKYDD